MMRRLKSLFWVVGLATVCSISFSQAADFPGRDFSGIIMWGAGGPTDVTSRAITPLVEKNLGKSIVLQNKSGASGAVSIQWVLSQPSDGYTLLYGAENPLLHKVMEIATHDYLDNFYPVILLARDTGLVVCRPDAPWKSIKDLFDDAKKNPGQIKVGTTGAIDIINVVTAMFQAENGVTFNKIPFSGGGTVITALLGGHIQFTVQGLGAMREQFRAGRLKPLVVMSDEKIPGMEDVPLITDIYPQYKKYMPWGTFYAVWVKKDVPGGPKKILVDTFQNAAKDPKFQGFLKDTGLTYIGTFGEEGNKFLKHWQSVTSWLLHSIGATKLSPDKFGIPKP